MGACALGIVAALGCAALSVEDARSRPGNAELRSAHYHDNSGLTVFTLGGRVDQPISSELSATLRAVADHVIVERTVVEVPPAISANQATGHVDELSPDIVTSASSVVSGGAGSDKWRKEIAPGLHWDSDDPTLPASVGVSLRYSTEPDYGSTLLLARGAASLFENNTTVSGFAGYGRDDVRPFEPPPGQEASWPARHERLLAGVSIAQLASPSLVLSGGVAVVRQRGALSNPYRRATVRTSLFPEVLPSERDRLTLFAAASQHLGARAALHARLGVYSDSWSVRALIPELILSKELGQRWLVRLGYRYYRQSSASFYQPVYPELGDILAGDQRLGRIVEHAPHAELEWQIFGHRDGFGALRAVGGVGLSWLDYRDLALDPVLGRVFQLGLLASY